MDSVGISHSLLDRAADFLALVLLARLGSHAFSQAPEVLQLILILLGE